MLLLHPDAARHARRVRQALGTGAVEVEPGAWLMDESTIDRALPALARLDKESESWASEWGLRGAYR